VFFCGHDGVITIQDQDPADHDRRLGEQLGGYLVVARVADGAMGRVYEGRHPETRARVAIKVLHADVVRDRVAVERFKREFETVAEMSHPHIVHVLEFGDTPDESYFMTMDYLVGRELGTALEAGQPLGTARALRILCQAALALDYAHSFGFIHRDLKPDNIFLCETPEGDDVRILDFGSVKLQVEVGAKLTAMGTTVGSPFYMSPEQAMGKADVDQRSDVFALGAILYEMLTGRIAFDAPNVAKILVRIMNEMPEAPSRVTDEAPAALDAVVLRALQKDKGARYASALELARAASSALGLSLEVEAAARMPVQELQRAIDAATPAATPEPGPEAEPERPAAGAPADAGADRDTRPRLGLSTHDQLEVPMKGLGGRSRTLAWVGVGLVALIAVVVVLLR
jgi:serine/threonine-protein kinase